jgi:predicted PurR-regulated permease PerM
MRDKKNKYLYAMLAGFGAIALSILLFFVLFRLKEIGGALGRLIKILQPFIFGGVIAYILRPACNWMEDMLTKHLPQKLKKTAAPVAVAASLILGLLAVTVLLWLVVPQLYVTIISLYNTLPGKFDQLVRDIEDYVENNEALANNISAVYETVKDSATDWLQTRVIPSLDSIVSGVGNGAWNSIIAIKNFLIGIIVSAYFLGGRRNFARQSRLVIYGVFKKKWAEKILDEVAYADRMFTGFISGKLFDSIIIGIICFVFCLVTRMPNALLISVIVGFTNIIPFFGPFIGAVPSTILILVESPMKAVWFVIFVIVIQTIDGNVLGPKILGDRIGLSSFWVLFGILLFGGLFGFIGMLVGVPLFAVIYDILKKLIYYGLEKHGYELDTEVSGDTETAVICDEVDVQAQVNDMTEGNK